jgi:uncharacterized NAD(P)/FAD-binding protein YdhS
VADAGNVTVIAARVIACTGAGTDVIGPLRRGRRWEPTAVRELREQAETVARGVCASLARRPAAPIATMAG